MDRVDHTNQGSVAGPVGPAPTRPQTSSLQIVAFDIASETFGVNIFRVREITRVPDLTRLPATTSGAESLLNLRGRLIPVMNMHRRLGLASASPSARSRIIVAEASGTLIAFIADRVHEVLHLPPEQVSPMPLLAASSIPADFVTGIGTPHDRIITLLDLNKVFASPASAAA